jgi:hypothetical protein
MAQSYLIFDFGANEEAAQQARHRIEGWKQAFRLDKRMQLKFERRAAEESGGSEPDAEKKKSAKGKADSAETNANERIRLIVRLDFSDHEKLSHQRWLERIPLEEPFKEAAPQIIRHGEDGFSATAELFDSLP